MEINGKIKLVKDTQEVSASFKKREFVVTTEEQYPQNILVEFTQDRVLLLDSFPIGTSVKVSVNVRGNEWINPQGEAKYFNTLQAWKIEKTDNF